jgi:hypothetical protein
MVKLIKWFTGMMMLLTGNLYSQTLTISWNTNTESDLAGYTVYYGDQSRLYSQSVNVGLDTEVMITDSVYFEYGKIYYFAVTAFDSSMNESAFSEEVSVLLANQFGGFDPLPALDEEDLARFRTEYLLYQNHPNPFNPETKTRFHLPEANHVVLRIYDILGKEIRTLADGIYEAGYHSLNWDGRDNHGNPLSSGIYLYQLQAGTFSEVKKMSLLR